MDPSLKNLLIFTAVALAGMLAHYIKSWTKNEISGNLLDYLFRDNPRSTVAAVGSVLGTAATAYLTGVLDGAVLKTLLPLAFTAGFSLDSTFNKGGTADPSPAQRAVNEANKASGFARITLLLMLLLGAALVAPLMGCAAPGGASSTPSTAAGGAYAAQQTVLLALTTAHNLRVAGTINAMTEQKIYAAAEALNAVAAPCNANPPSPTCAPAAVDAALTQLTALLPTLVPAVPTK